MKGILMDEDEESSVTAAAVNVICELSWRRPRDFLPLAPRLFDLLLDGGNNWMAIKIIKLFASLTPLEPRLVKRLLPPLATIIRTTPAMSLLYECINSIIQGGFFDEQDASQEREEIARLCVGKLCDMIAIEGDPNLKYVALLAFEKIAAAHPYLVSIHQEIIFRCLDDADISIRLQALSIGCQMINGDNLVLIVSRLLDQLRQASSQAKTARPTEQAGSSQIEPAADLDDEDPEESLRGPDLGPGKQLSMPVEYQKSIIDKILEMCGRDSFANVEDFEWYIQVLMDLHRLTPRSLADDQGGGAEQSSKPETSAKIGMEIRNIAIRVPSVRLAAVQAANTLLAAAAGQDHIAGPDRGILACAAWIAGEYAGILPQADETLDHLMLLPLGSLEPGVLSVFLQSLPKMLASVLREKTLAWSGEMKARVSLILARTINLVEPLTMHTALEVQERAVECLELARLSAEAVDSHDTTNLTGPGMLATGIPSLFQGTDLNPVAATAQRKVPLPDGFDFSQALNAHLDMFLNKEDGLPGDTDFDSAQNFYFQRPRPLSHPESSAAATSLGKSSNQGSSSRPRSPAQPALGRAERYARYQDDPFYITAPQEQQNPVSPVSHGRKEPDMDVDSIPIMDLGVGGSMDGSDTPDSTLTGAARPQKRRVHVAAEENFDNIGFQSGETDTKPSLGFKDNKAVRRAQAGLLQVDSSDIGSLDLEDGAVTGADNSKEEDEMAKALAEVERMRLEMQRASERAAHESSIPAEGALVKKKVKKKRKKETRPVSSRKGSHQRNEGAEHLSA